MNPTLPSRQEKLTEIHQKIQKPINRGMARHAPGKISAKAKRFAEYEAKRKLCYAERRHQQFKKDLIETLKNTSWWLISSVFHTLLFILSTHVIFQYIERKPPLHIFQVGWFFEKPLAVESQIKAEIQKEEKEEAPKEEKKSEVPVLAEDIPNPVEKEVPIPLGIQGTAPNPQQTPPTSPFSGRTTEGKGDALKKYGGSSGTEAAVKNGLDWLVRHQSLNGSWSGTQYLQYCRGIPCDQETIYYDYISGFTGLALLCFLGAGETHLEGNYQKNISKGLQFLLKNQRKDGYFGPDTPFLYNHTIALLAIIEAYGITKDSKLKESAQKGIDFLCQCQQSGGGWDYYNIITNRNDTSITGWAIMALKSARSSGFTLPPSVWKKAQKCMDKMHDSDGGYSYADKGPPANFKGRKGAGMTAVGTLCSLYFGEPLNSKRTLDSADLLKKYKPNWQRLVETNPNPVPQPGTNVIYFNKEIYNYSVYAWYYGTLVMFQVGGDYWELWNNAMKEALLSNQNRNGCNAGSWDPVEKWIGPFGGRLYSTTLNILNLEVYYRYLPIYQTIEVVPELTDQEIVTQAKKILEEGSQRNKAAALDQLSEITDEESRKTALKQTCEMLKDESLTIRWKAIKTLRQMKNEESLPAIFEAYRSKKNKMLRRFMIETLAEFPHPSVFPFLIQILEGKEDALSTKALESLKFWSGENLGLSPEAWKSWWEKRQKNIPNPH
ncbi:MAG: HEAT repeat domain-containing protein [Planctomycetota bacterium]